MTSPQTSPSTDLQPAVVRDLRPVPPQGRTTTKSSLRTFRRASRGFPGQSTSVGDARRFVRRTLTAWALPGTVVDDALLLASELVTNAVTHTLSHRVHVHVSLTSTVVTVTVVDRGPHRPIQPQQATPDAEHGRGLQIVENIADRWGRLLLDPGTAVWARLNLPDPTDAEVTR